MVLLVYNKNQMVVRPPNLHFIEDLNLTSQFCFKKEGIVENHFCVGIFFRELAGEAYVLGLNESISNMNKLVGGTNKNASWETPAQTLKREFSEETTDDGKDGSGLMPKVFHEVKHIPLEGHDKYGFLIMDVEGEFGIDEVRTRQEKDHRTLKVRWFKVADFKKDLLPSHRPLFDEACAKMAELRPEFGALLQ